MLMPIVSMNKMAMNESVATTCCFREVATPTAMYWEVLNGGWIGSGYGEVTVKKAGYENLHDSWLNYNYDIQFGAGNDAMRGIARYETQSVPGATPADPWVETTGWFVYDPAGAGSMDLGSFLAAPATLIPSAVGGPLLVRPGGNCDHKTNTSCIYRENRAGFLNDKNYHFESKTKHSTGGDNWDKPHEAKKFSS